MFSRIEFLKGELVASIVPTHGFGWYIPVTNRDELRYILVEGIIDMSN